MYPLINSKVSEHLQPCVVDTVFAQMTSLIPQIVLYELEGLMFSLITGGPGQASPADNIRILCCPCWFRIVIADFMWEKRSLLYKRKVQCILSSTARNVLALVFMRKAAAFLLLFLVRSRDVRVPFFHSSFLTSKNSEYISPSADNPLIEILR